MTTARPAGANRRAALCSAAMLATALTASTAQRAEARSDRVRQESRLIATANGPLRASGEIEIERRSNRLEFKVEIEDIAPGAYDLYVDDVLRGVLNAVQVPGGVEAELEFRDPPQPGKIPLDFDPVGASVEVRSGGVAILTGVAPGLNTPDGSSSSGQFNKQNINGFLSATDAFPPARGTMKFNSNKNKAKLKIDTLALPSGLYEVRFDGVHVGDLSSNGRKGKAKFSTNPGGSDQMMGFDPVNALAQIVKDDIVYLEGGIEGDPMGGGASPAGVAGTEFAPSAAAPRASGDAELRVRNGRIDFNVEIEDVPLGDYALLINGFEVATITVVNTPSGPQGELEFRDPVEPGKLPLDFDPLGATIQIVSSMGDVVLAGEIPSQIAGSFSDDSQSDDSSFDDSDDDSNSSSGSSSSDDDDDDDHDDDRGRNRGRGGRR